MPSENMELKAQTDRGVNRDDANAALVAELQGRFSGRLKFKADEKVLMDRCRQLSPLLGGCPGTGDDSMSHLSAIVRGVASGQVYRTLHEREELITVVARSLLCAWGGRPQLLRIQQTFSRPAVSFHTQLALVGNFACPP